MALSGYIGDDAEFDAAFGTKTAVPLVRDDDPWALT
jgi:hypothetical protein